MKSFSKKKIYWKQCAKINWLSEGDYNTAYFHKYASARRKRNLIHHLIDSDNSIISTQEDLENHITNYFSRLFTSQNSTADDISNISNVVNQGVTQSINDFLDTPFTDEEIKKALFDIQPSKASGPDGFTALFFQNA